MSDFTADLDIFKSQPLRTGIRKELTAPIKTRQKKFSLGRRKAQKIIDGVFRLLLLHTILLPAGQSLPTHAVLVTILGITLGSQSDALSVTINNSSSIVSTATE